MRILCAFISFEVHHWLPDQKKIIIMVLRAADFHNFNALLPSNPEFKVEAFDGVPDSEYRGRTVSAGTGRGGVSAGIPIFDEAELPDLIRKFQPDEIIFAYSDVPHVEVMHRAAQANALAPDFRLMAAQTTMLKSVRR